MKLTALFYLFHTPVRLFIYILFTLNLDGEYFFVYSDASIHKVAPADWKKKSKSGLKQSTNFVLYFRVKFYVTDFDQLRHVLQCLCFNFQ